MTKLHNPISEHPPGTPAWIELNPRDQAVAHQFYGALFGWSFSAVQAELGNCSMATLHGAPAAGVTRGCGWGPEVVGEQASEHGWLVYLASVDAEVSCARILELGGQVIAPPRKLGGAGSVALARDVDGVPVGVWQADAHQGMGAIGEAGFMAWCEVNACQQKQEVSFYEALTELSGSPMDMGSVRYTLLGDGRPRFGVLQMTEEWGKMAPHWMVYFSVEDADASAERVEELGGQAPYGAFDTPFGRIAVCRDSEGNAFSVVKPKGS